MCREECNRFSYIVEEYILNGSFAKTDIFVFLIILLYHVFCVSKPKNIKQTVGGLF